MRLVAIVSYSYTCSCAYVIVKPGCLCAKKLLFTQVIDCPCQEILILWHEGKVGRTAFSVTDMLTKFLLINNYSPKGIIRGLLDNIH